MSTTKESAYRICKKKRKIESKNLLNFRRQERRWGGGEGSVGGVKKTYNKYKEAPSDSIFLV